MINLLWMPGGGGHWLMHTVHCLQTNTIPIAHKYSETYDYDVQTPDIHKGHWHYQFDNPSSIVLFSTKHLFNISCASLIKNRVDLKDPTGIKALEYYTNAALYHTNDNIYNTDIRLNHDWLYNNPEKFIAALYDILDESGIKYNKNDAMLRESMHNYISTFSISDYYMNWDSLFWLGWCHAVLTNAKIDVQTDVYKCTINEVQGLFRQHEDYCVAEIKKFIIPGTYE